MRELIISNVDECEGCNRCIRNCPIEEANIAYFEDGRSKVKTNSEKCIVCGACVKACNHNARDYIDDTDRFFRDLEDEVPISLMAAPANRTNFEEWKRIIAWLKSIGVNKVFDVSLGADICTWAHIRFIEKYSPGPLITQPCPAIVNYITKHKRELVPYLSKIHSPMLCTAVFMRDYVGIKDKIACLSPCIAKATEFEDTGYVSYNVTFNRLNEYIKENNIKLPLEGEDFDNMDAGLGRIYSMPGGLKENVEFFLGKKVRVDKSEGQSVVYSSLDEYALQDDNFLPAIFDVLNCPEGCNMGTACGSDISTFEINSMMDKERQFSINNFDSEESKKIYELYDRKLKLESFIREYKDVSVKPISISEMDIEDAFIKLGKFTSQQRNHNCFSCGSETCNEMAIKIAKGLNVPENCIEKTRSDLFIEHEAYLKEQEKNIEYISSMMEEILEIKNNSDEVISKIECINNSLVEFSQMANTISKISMQTNLISLNASIEAARVGKYGKAFSVVADEIRALARSSQDSVENNTQTQEEAVDSLKKVDSLILNMANLIERTYNNVSYLYESVKPSEHNAS